MDRAAVLVDAGYLFAAGSKLIAGERLPRGQLHLDFDRVLELMRQLSEELTGLPLLRIYWYDGTAAGPTPQQQALAYRPSVKLRLGFVNQFGEQKGVDSLVVTDLITLSRNRAVADVVLLSGDEDIRVGVQQAQEFGVRVHLLGIAPARENQSAFLVQEADALRELTLAEVQSFLSHAAQPTSGAEPASSDPAPKEAAAASSTALETAAQELAAELEPEEVRALREAMPDTVPPEIDRRLLLAGSQALGAPLTLEQKRRIRAVLFDLCRTGP